MKHTIKAYSIMKSGNYVKMRVDADGGWERSLLGREIFRVVRNKDSRIKETEIACPIGVYPLACEAAGKSLLSPIFVKLGSDKRSVRTIGSDKPATVSNLCWKVRADEHRPALVDPCSN